MTTPQIPPLAPRAALRYQHVAADRARFIAMGIDELLRK